ncbi:hypothetical protein SCHPADRAFT_935140 [Schizopora paradoxa]|uniref:Uncharacterized protein n=1 Tax=Schizopora paradoxa TaxID=27342 RepID=A0A0H2S614_9AGAM|nr:hypothetical protein SCHPADRAFT_935140 [Schizopora paradoxa]
MSLNLVALITELLPLIDAALAIGKDGETMDILRRISEDPQSIDKTSCTEKEQQVMNALSVSSKTKSEHSDTTDLEILSECLTKCAKL